MTKSEILGALAVGLALFIAVMLVLSLLFSYLWNSVVSPVFGMPVLTAPEASGILLLTWIFGVFFRGGFSAKTSSK